MNRICLIYLPYLRPLTCLLADDIDIDSLSAYLVRYGNLRQHAENRVLLASLTLVLHGFS